MAGWQRRLTARPVPAWRASARLTVYRASGALLDLEAGRFILEAGRFIGVNGGRRT